jgi:hypothetical protein
MCSLLFEQLKQIAMKTRNFVLTALAVIVATAASATKIPTLNVVPVQKQKALVAFENTKPAAVEISVKNQVGEVLYYKKSEKPVENFHMLFDFHDLQDGVYDVSLDFNNCKINREITITNHLLKNVGKQERAFGPYCKLENNLLKVSYLNSKESNVSMSIYQDGNFVTGKKLGKDLTIQKAIDLSKLESGKYDIVLSSNNDEYLFTVSK